MTLNRQEALQFLRRGEPWVWVTSAGLTIILFVALTLLGVVVINGLRYFWPARLVDARLPDGTHILGEITNKDVAPDDHTRKRLQFKIANREIYGQDFRWVDESQLTGLNWPEQAIALERMENGNFYGYLNELSLPALNQPILRGTTAQLWPRLLEAQRTLRKRESEVIKLRKTMGKLSLQKENIRRRRLQLEYQKVPANDPQYAKLQNQDKELDQQFNQINEQSRQLQLELRRNTAGLSESGGREQKIAIVDIVRAWRPNAMGFLSRCAYSFSKIKELLIEEPREANTEGGLFPAIFGTVLMVLLMSLFCIPMGVLAAVYLREYAHEGLLVRMVRIGVNNLSGVPSIVYGVFGLGFFVYGIGGSIDKIFYPELGNTPIFGTGGILWASLTLALLTVPVVIVATEESLAAVPRGIREGSLALGATKLQTLIRILLPLASPGIMTGFILAMARAAGEVAPLMLVGVVKSAPALPLDVSFPFIHLDRKFMHLAFAIFDSGFQSPNVEAARPMVYVTTLLLLVIVICLSSAAVVLRHRMRRRYSMESF